MRHRPNGGVVTLELFRIPSSTADRKDAIASTNTKSAPDRSTLIDTASGEFSRDSRPIVKVGKPAFICGKDDWQYRIGVRASGDYRGGATVTLRAVFSKQREFDS